MVGAEMPPYEKSSKSIGNGIKGISDEEAQQDTMSTNQFTIAIDKIYDANKKLTPKAAELAAMLSQPLGRLPVHLAVQCSDESRFGEVTAFATHMFEAEGVRPGQVAIGFSRNIPDGFMRFSIERYEQ